jgi:hypothetical protein
MFDPAVFEKKDVRHFSKTNTKAIPTSEKKEES